MSDYFTPEEMRCKGSGLAYPTKFVKSGVWDRLRGDINSLRDRYGYAIDVISGYRDPKYNAELREASIQRRVDSGLTRAQAEKACGVAKDSRHMYGEAVDLRPSVGTAVHLYALGMSMIEAGELKNIGAMRLYERENWVHFDCRPRKPDGSIITWE